MKKQVYISASELSDFVFCRLSWALKYQQGCGPDPIARAEQAAGFIAPSFPHPVSMFLTEHGYNVLEAQSAEEALSISPAHDVDAVIVAGGGDYPGLAELRQRRMTVNLTIHATGPDVFFELSHLLPNPSDRLQ